jgi:hypothetical protein
LPEVSAIDASSIRAHGAQIPCVVSQGDALLFSRVLPHHEQSRLISNPCLLKARNLTEHEAPAVVLASGAFYFQGE